MSSSGRPWDYREWEYAKTPAPPHCERFIVVSYNILADYLASTHRNLYNHIPDDMMKWEWRKEKLMVELGLWSADIMCFQEVDKFHDLEEQLKCRGYSGIWKMRTGIAIDGCAIFWRTSRFKLLHEESIEFNKHQLRDNVAQICVLEIKSQNEDENEAAESDHKKVVVVCNIHVLYNPKRGEIKLGQVRRLLERADAVSKSWDDAPVLLCGDFNCTPNSPLYNFISQQKLNLSRVDRDKVSGQASAQISTTPPPRPQSQSESGDSSCVGVPVTTVDVKELVAGMDKITTYDIPSVWSPMEIATAGATSGGSEDCNLLIQHSLQLKSTYTEVKELELSVNSGTRDSNGEPLVTSYNRRFLGSVDYIWRSQGLHTVRVLAPFPKHAMQYWTPGFPTDKWASDHIALASELAFTKHINNN
ncbi:Endonuclease/exonuclease/phosphatase [Corchorus capsularis]|uniref:Endonuclease/exonuclease/phosphatase n=1 Tax=Corchorus capsularis TaxID=210143 RepID=A0A1R3IBK8_COCAP|nr:Endonuclease/exonuclease/phosphatase [Corchorus capsularis]